MKILIFLIMFISLDGLATVSLNGLWKLKDFNCKDGTQSEFVKLNRSLYAMGRTEETLEIENKTAIFSMKNWSTSKKNYCTQRSNEIWDIDESTSTYRVLKRNIPPVENHGRKCLSLNQMSPLPQSRSFELSQDTLKIFGTFRGVKTKKVCKIGPLEWIYVRVQ